MADTKSFSLNIEMLEDFVFKIDFDELGYIITDEPPPLGQGEGPNPALLVGAAAANCLCASLLFSLRKKKQTLPVVTANVAGEITRIDGNWRISKIGVDITAETEAIDSAVLKTALEQFENYCIVTQSIRHGIPIDVRVKASSGELLHASG